MIRAGLYSQGSDPILDEAVRLYPGLDEFVTLTAPDAAASFDLLSQKLAVMASDLPRAG